jgi:tyrosinase
MSARESDTITEWSVRLISKKNALGESYTILLFLGEVPENVEDWRMSPNLVGTHYVMTHSRPVPDPHDGFEVEGIIPLNLALEDHLPSLTSALVVPYVHKNIHWRIQKASAVPLTLLSHPSTA